MNDDLSRHAQESTTRREFLQRAALGATALGAAATASAAPTEPQRGTTASNKMPMRILGNTGARVSLLGFGGGSRFLTESEDKAAAMLERAVAAGITNFDTAASYGVDRESERRFGRTLPRHRSRIFLATKSATAPTTA
jgi:hypothetical protein